MGQKCYEIFGQVEDSIIKLFKDILNNYINKQIKFFLIAMTIQFGPVNWIHFWCGMESNLLHTASKVYPIHCTKLYFDTISNTFNEDKD